MTVAVAGAGRAVATRAAAAGGSRPGSGKVINGRVVDRAPSSSASSSASRGRGLLGDAASGLVSGSAIGRGIRRADGHPSGAGSTARRVLVAEFAVCMVVLALSPATDRKRDESPAAFMKRASAVMALFFVLGLISTGGRGASKAAAGFGGLVTLTLLISQRSLFALIASKVGGTDGEHPPDDEHLPGDDDDQDDDGGWFPTRPGSANPPLR